MQCSRKAGLERQSMAKSSGRRGSKGSEGWQEVKAGKAVKAGEAVKAMRQNLRSLLTPRELLLETEKIELKKGGMTRGKGAL